MGDIETAALRLGLFTLAFLIIVIAFMWRRRARARPAAPRARKAPRDTAPVEEKVEITPSRLARIGRKEAVDQLSAPPHEAALAVRTGPVPDPETNAQPIAEAAIDAVAPDFDEPDIDTAMADEPIVDEPIAESFPADAPGIGARAHPDGPAAVRLIPRIPPHGAAPPQSWLGGRPRLPADMEWPKVDGREGDFLAQIACADLPADLWDGLSPRSGSILLFANPDSGAPMALHVPEDGPPRDPPRAAGVLWAGPDGDLAPLAHRAFPEWPVDAVPVEAEEETEAAVAALSDADISDYDVADPAFHPFDWDSMLALAAILDSRLPADPDDANRDACLHAREIVAIIRDSAGEAPFSTDDAMAVMAGLQAIRWTSEGHGGSQTLPLTRHLADADFWVGDYRRLLFDHARHAWCADPDRLPVPTRALFEPQWRAMAASEAAASMGGSPERPRSGFDEELDALLFTLPASALMNRALPGGRDMRIVARKADLAMGDFSRLRLLAD